MSEVFSVLNPYQKWKKGDLPCDPTITIVLKQWGFDDDVVKISATLAADSEIDFAIDRLKNNLELVRKEAKRVLKRQREKIRSSFEE